MAEVRVELLLVVLTGALLLVSVRAWEPIKDSQLNFYESVQWSEPQGVASQDKPLPETWHSYDGGSDYDGGKDSNFEDAFPQVEGAATVNNFDHFAQHGFEVDAEDSGQTNLASRVDDGFQVEFVDANVGAPPRSWAGSTSQSSTNANMVCSEDGFHITLTTRSLSDVNVWASNELLPVMDVPASCGYEINSLTNTLNVPFSGCYVKQDCSTNSYSLQLFYTESDQIKVVSASCEAKKGPFPRSTGKPSKCIDPTPPLPAKAQNCAVTARERVICGHSGISSSECEKMGCCVDSSACYYPLDECTGDQHFVFAIRYNSASIPVDPTKLVVPGSPNCKPVIVDDEVAIFKFKVTECGARAYQVGETKIYLAEVQTIVQALNLKYGVVTRSDPLRFMVECRYSKSGSTQQSLASVGYMVKIPASNLPSAVSSTGLYGVQLRIANDKTYSSYLPTNSQLLRLLLGTPVYLELRVLSPKPKAVLLVNYCIAYPRSAKNALVLVYEGCGNPYDPNVSILQVSDLPKNRHERHFVVKAFQFMEQKTNKYLDEEIYFMCSSEVCMPAEKTCEERCFDGKAP